MKLVLNASLLAAVVLVGCTPVSRQDASRAEDECRAEARDLGFREISVTTGAIGIGDIIDYGLSARRHGNDYTGTCVYDKDSRRAEVTFNEATADGDDGFAHAREVCTEEAELRGYAPGTVLDNLGCLEAEGRVWCDVQELGGGPRGYVAAEFLTPAISPDGSRAGGSSRRPAAVAMRVTAAASRSPSRTCSGSAEARRRLRSTSGHRTSPPFRWSATRAAMWCTGSIRRTGTG